MPYVPPKMRWRVCWQTTRMHAHQRIPIETYLQMNDAEPGLMAAARRAIIERYAEGMNW